MNHTQQEVFDRLPEGVQYELKKMWASGEASIYNGETKTKEQSNKITLRQTGRLLDPSVGDYVTLYLKARERYYIENNTCVNKCIPGRTRRESEKAYFQKNKTMIYTKNKKYRDDNKAKIKAHNNKKNKCSCGGSYTNGNKGNHFKTKKHINHVTQE